MMDVVNRATRSRMMSGIRGKDTTPELVVRRFLHRAGFRYRLHGRNLPGSPDIVLPRWNAVVLVHGCFWHAHEGCRYFRVPASRREFWEGKLLGNRARDLRNAAALEERGWRVGVVWECAIRSRAELGPLADWIRSGSPGRFEMGLDSLE